jgi:hypothetical protein
MDRHTGTKVKSKFFLSSRKKDPVKAISRLTREFDNLHDARLWADA